MVILKLSLELFHVTPSPHSVLVRKHFVLRFACYWVLCIYVLRLSWFLCFGFLYHDASDFASDVAFLLRLEGNGILKIRWAYSNMHGHYLSHFKNVLNLHTNTHMLFYTCITPHLYTTPLIAWGGVDGLDIWSWLTRSENGGKLGEAILELLSFRKQFR